MNEVLLGFKGLTGILLTAVCSFFWMAGGRDIKELQAAGLGLFGWDKANRFWGRFFAPLVYCAGMAGLAVWSARLNFWLLGFPVLAFIGATLPHKTPVKRVLKALLWCSAGAFLCMVTGRWWLLMLQYVFGVSAQLIWGTRNPTPAPLEELGIYFAMSWLTPFMLV